MSVDTETSTSISSSLMATAKKFPRMSSMTALPDKILFAGFQIQQAQTLKLKLLNTGTDTVRYRVVPPLSDSFKLHYVKKNGLRPGLSEDVTVTFTPTTYKTYQDSIRVVVQGDDLIIPLQGYPAAKNITLPKTVDFGECPIGHPVTKDIPIQCKAPIDFGYEVVLLKSNNDFNIEPAKGLITPDGDARLSITYTPTKYNTSEMKFQLLVSQPNWKPLTCQVMGSCRPGKAKEIYKLEMTSTIPRPPSDSPDKHTSSPRRGSISGMKARRPSRSKSTQSPAKNTPESESPEKRGSIRIPKKKEGIAFVNAILNQPPSGRLGAGAAARTSKLKATKQRNNKPSGSAILNDLRCQDGYTPLTEAKRDEILRAREQAHAHYASLKGEGAAADTSALQRPTNQSDGELIRTLRRLGNSSEQDIESAPTAVEQQQVSFQQDVVAEVSRRAFVLDRFVRAARTVVIQNRAQKRLLHLKKLLKSPEYLAEMNDPNISDNTKKKTTTSVESPDGGCTSSAVGSSTSESAKILTPRTDAFMPLTFFKEPITSFLPEASPPEEVAVTFPPVPKIEEFVAHLETPREADILGYSTIQPPDIFSYDQDDV